MSLSILQFFGPLITAFLSSLGLLLVWQFGVFMLLTQVHQGIILVESALLRESIDGRAMLLIDWAFQVSALFAVCLLGYPVSIVIRRISAFYSIVVALAFALQFAPRYLVSMPVEICISMGNILKIGWLYFG